MFEKTQKYMITAALLVLLTAGLTVAVRPGEIHPLNVTSGITIGYMTGTDTSTTTTLPPAPNIIGGQTDTHGCLTAAGFAWNATTSNCVRPWNGDIQLTTGTMLVNISDPHWREHLAVTLPVSTQAKCVSSNGGDIFTPGKVFVLGQNPKIDGCFRHQFLREWYCSGDRAVSTFVTCKKGCKNGACLPENAVTTTTTSTSSTTTLPQVTTTTLVQ